MVHNVRSAEVSFTAMKLTRQASQYLANFENLCEIKGEHPISTWHDIKTQLKQKYLPPYYYLRLLDKSNQFSQGSCHAPLPKIRWSGDATRVGDAYTQGKYLTYTR